MMDPTLGRRPPCTMRPFTRGKMMPLSTAVRPRRRIFCLLAALIIFSWVRVTLALPPPTRSFPAAVAVLTNAPFGPSGTIVPRDLPTISTMLPEGPHQPIGLPVGPFETVITAEGPSLLPQDTATDAVATPLVASTSTAVPFGRPGPGPGRPQGLNQLLHASIGVHLGSSPSPSPTFDINRFLIPTPSPRPPPPDSDAFKRGCEPVYHADGSEAGYCKWGKYWKLTMSSAMAAPDGFQRETLLFNDQTPGPTIHGYEGEEICVSAAPCILVNESS